MKRVWLAVLILAAVARTGAQEIKVPWDQLATKADQVVNITMDKKMLQFASKFMEKEDAEGKRVIAKLNGIYVRTLEFKNLDAFSDSDLEPIRAQLRGAEWSRMMEIGNKAGKERVEIYMKTVDGQTMGMVVLCQEAKELTFVHLDGPISPEDLDDLGGNFGIPKDIHELEKEKHPAKPAVKK